MQIDFITVWDSIVAIFGFLIVFVVIPLLIAALLPWFSKKRVGSWLDAQAVSFAQAGLIVGAVFMGLVRLGSAMLMGHW